MEPEATANHTAFEVLFAYFASQGPTQVPFNLPPDLHHLIPLPTQSRPPDSNHRSHMPLEGKGVWSYTRFWSQPSPRPEKLRSSSETPSDMLAVWSNSGLYPLPEATSTLNVVLGPRSLT